VVTGAPPKRRCVVAGEAVATVEGLGARIRVGQPGEAGATPTASSSSAWPAPVPECARRTDGPASSRTRGSGVAPLTATRPDTTMPRSEPGNPGVDARGDEQDDGHGDDGESGPDDAGRARRQSGLDRRHDRVAARARSPAEGRPDVLPDDDDRDPEGEHLDDPPRDERDDPAESERASCEHHEACHDADERHDARPAGDSGGEPSPSPSPSPRRRVDAPRRFRGAIRREESTRGAEEEGPEARAEVRRACYERETCDAWDSFGGCTSTQPVISLDRSGRVYRGAPGLSQGDP
jgi:hypothetical protein